MAAPDGSLSDEFIQRQRHRRGGRVAVVVDRDHQFLQRHLELARRRLEDAHVGLVGNEPVDVVERHAGRGHGFARRLLQHAHGVLEHALPVHLQERRAEDAAARHVARHGQQAGLAAVGVQPAGVDSRLVAGHQHRGAGAVAEQHAGAAIIPVEDAGKDFRADNESTLRISTLYKIICNSKAINETAAYGLHVEGGTAFHAELRLQQGGGAGKHHVRRRGGDDDEIDVRRRDAGGGERRAARGEREVARALRLVGDVAADDAGPLADPGVAGLETLRELVIGHDPRRQEASAAGNARPDHRTGTSCCAMRASMRCGTLLRTSSTARSSACPKANTSAEPWLLMTMPFSPSRLAPLYWPGSMRLRSALNTGVASSAANMRHGLRLNSSRRNAMIILAKPSEAFSTELPTNPSHPTTSVVPLKMPSPSTLP